MTEIERIITDVGARNHPDDWRREIAKALEQYVIKARIEEVSGITFLNSPDMLIEKLEKYKSERIALLKKGLSDD